jgi:Ca-activated chloride channel family protein
VADFHFLRPAWLFALVPLAVLLVVHYRRRRGGAAMGGFIAPHLLDHLTVGASGARRPGPWALAAGVAALMTIALAGPTWEREPPPFADDRAALVVAIDASRSMNCIDVAPTRLERAKQKVRDLLALRAGAKTALVAYAGSAHLVLPLTEDRAILETYLEAVATDVMPEQGQRPDRALEVARDLLRRQNASGSILLLTDALPAGEFTGKELVLAVGGRRGGPLRVKGGLETTDPAPPLDLEALRRSGANVTELTADDADVRRLAGKAERNLVNVEAAGEGARWKDVGYYLVFPCLVLGLLWFRRGWIVRWAFLLVLYVPGCDADAWWTADQQGRRLFEAGAYGEAAERFDDPFWRGIALYRAGKYEEAIAPFALAGAHFNRGNCHMRRKEYDEAIEAYGEALKRDAEDADARFNLALARRLREQQSRDDEETGDATELGADEIKFDNKNKDEDKGTEGVVARTYDEKTAELWMRQVQTTPAEFLRLKFQFQEAREK